MTERDLGQSFSWWIAEVVNVYDPDQSGRVQIRVFGRHDDKSNIPDDDLPWALPMQPVTSAAFGKIGTTPLGLVKGSKVAGFWADSDHQYPIIIGSFGKAGEFIDGTTNDGIPQVDISKGSAPAPSQNQSPPPFINPFSILNTARLVVTDINSGKSDPSQLTNKDGVNIRTELDKSFKQPNTPSIASAAPGQHILDTIKQVDPDSKSASLPNMVSNFSNIRNIISMTSPLGQTNMMGTILGSVIGNLANEFGLTNTISSILGSVGGANLGPILGKALSIGVTLAVSSAVSNNGTTSAYTPPKSNVIGPNTPRPPANLIVKVVPNLYIQQYYAAVSDPFPGYIQWKGPNGDFVYTLRNGEPNYASAQEHVQGNSIASISSSFLPHINSGSLTSAVLSGLLVGGLAGMNADSLTKILGSGVSLASMLNLAKSLLTGNLGAAITGVIQNHLPQSVLNGSMQNTMTEFTQNQANLQKKKDSMQAALTDTPDQADADLINGCKYLALKKSYDDQLAGGSGVISETITSPDTGQQYNLTFVPSATVHEPTVTKI